MLNTQGCLALACLLGAAIAAQAGETEEPIKPIPQSLHQDRLRAALGRQLFNDTRLSANNTMSCASCHNLAQGGGDSRPLSVGFDGKKTGVNTPSVMNAAFNFKQFWNGRAETLEAQIDLVVKNPVEMGSKWDDVVRKLSQDANYRRDFSASYKDGITKGNIQNAIATFERTLITPNSRFDRFLRGERDAITATEQTGYAKFKRYGCIACHQGVNVGGNMFQKFGVMGDFFAQGRAQTEADQGRFNVTGKEDDRHVFKVPSLRNVALTAPYFHDASAKTLGDAVDVMFKYQLGRTASKADKDDIIQFLNTLSGQATVTP